MYLIQSWKDSLSLFVPPNLRLFFLVTVKTIKETYLNALKYFWWFIGLYIAIKCTYSTAYLPEKAYQLMSALLSSLWIFILVLITRASIAKKDSSYFIKHSKFVPAVFGGQLLIASIIAIANIPLLYLESWGNTPILFSYAFALSIVFEVSSTLFYFFEFDMPLNLRNWVKAIRFAFRMFFYNVPIYFILVGALFFTFACVDWGIGYLCVLIQTDCSSLFNLLGLVKEPILVVLISNLYIKRLHEQPQLYFKEPKEE